MKKKSKYEDVKRRIDVVLNCAQGDKINICYAFYKLIRGSPANLQSRLLQYVAEEHDETESNEELTVDSFINKNETEKLRERFGNLADQILECLIKENPSPAEFYKQLWAAVQNPMFRSEKAKAFVFYYMMIDRKIPYFKIDPGLRMADEDWRSTARRLRTSRAKLRFLLARGIEQRSEEGDLVVKVLDEHKPEEKAALMAYILFELRQRNRNLNSLISDSEEE